MRMLLSRVNAEAPTILPGSSRIGAIEIETSIRRPSLAMRWVSTWRTASPARTLASRLPDPPRRSGGTSIGIEAPSASSGE